MNSEKVAYWFFRLNGCFTFENFIVHPDTKGGQQTDADLIALRFMHRSELKTSGEPMQDHSLFNPQQRQISVFLVEVKTTECAINGPWKKRERRNLHRVLYAMGLLPVEKVEEAAHELYHTLKYEDEQMTIQFVAVGREKQQKGTVKNAKQITWDEILRWIYERFNQYKDQKADHDQWEESGKKLYESAVKHFKKDAPVLFRTGKKALAWMLTSLDRDVIFDDLWLAASRTPQTVCLGSTLGST